MFLLIYIKFLFQLVKMVTFCSDMLECLWNRKYVTSRMGHVSNDSQRAKSLAKWGTSVNFLLDTYVTLW